MITPKRLIKIARKWQKLAAVRRKMISFPRNTREKKDQQRAIISSRNDVSLPVADKGHFVVYTADEKKRFMFPMSYLNNLLFRELLAMSEEEFGLPGNGPITLPCDAAFMDYAVSLIKRRVGKEMEAALLVSISNTSSSSTTRCSSSNYLCPHTQHLPVPGF